MVGDEEGGGWGGGGGQGRGEVGILLREFFLLGDGNRTRSDFDHLNFFQSLKQHSVHIDHPLK